MELVALWGLLLLGNLINISMEINKGLKSDETNFNVLGDWFKNVKNFMYVFIGLTTSIALLLSIDYKDFGLLEIGPVKMYWSHVCAIVVGYLGQFIWSKLMKVAKTEISKKLK